MFCYQKVLHKSNEMMDMKRRSLLAGIGVTKAVLAGCMWSGSGCKYGDSVTFEPVDVEAITSREATPQGDLLGDTNTPKMMAELAIQTLEGDEPEIEILSRSPLDWLTYVEWNGRFYEINEETIAEGSVSGPEYEISHNRENSDGASAEDALSFTDLPLHDQWRINEAADFAVGDGGGELPVFSAISLVAGYLDPGDQDESVLATSVDYSAIEVDGSVVELMHVGEGTATARQLRYTADVVAEDADTFVNQILEQRGTELSSLSEDAVELLQEAKENDGNVLVCADDRHEEETGTLVGEKWRSAANELSNIDASYVRYEGQWYRFDVVTY